MKMIKCVLAILSVVLAVMNSGCASIVSRKIYNVPLQSNENSSVDVYNRGKFLMTVEAPTVLSLHSGASFFVPSHYTFTFKKDGYPDTVKKLDASLDGWYFGNIIFGGLLGMLIIDPATGAMYKLDESPLGVNWVDTNAQK